MTNVLILGAGGQIARWAIEMLADEDVELTLFLRHASKLPDAPEGARVVQGDVLDREQLDPAVRGQDIIYAESSKSSPAWKPGALKSETRCVRCTDA